MPDVFNSPKADNISSQVEYKNSEAVDLRKKLSRMENEKGGQVLHPLEKVGVHNLPGHSHNVLSAYCLYPDHVRFINADLEEKVVLILRKHPITNIPWIITAFLMLILPSFITLFPFLDSLPNGYEIILILSWYLITFAFVLEKFLSWFFNVNLITDERIFDVDFHNLMYREITEANLDQIQDVTVEVGGGLRTFFGYGNVLIQTAAEKARIEFAAVPHPDRVAKVLRELGIEEQIEKLEGRIR